MRISIIAAVAENGVIGRNGKLPWHLAEDLKRFKKITMGHTIVMGRRTWESIGRPLPGRRMIVVSRQPDYRTSSDSVEVCASLADAIRLAESAGEDEAFVIGGAELYREALPQAEKLYLTLVHAHVSGDAWFPEVDWADWEPLHARRFSANAENEFPFTFESFERNQTY
jgi:dihydrofolate reductase